MLCTQASFTSDGRVVDDKQPQSVMRPFTIFSDKPVSNSNRFVLSWVVYAYSNGVLVLWLL